MKNKFKNLLIKGIEIGAFVAMIVKTLEFIKGQMDIFYPDEPVTVPAAAPEDIIEKDADS